MISTTFNSLCSHPEEATEMRAFLRRVVANTASPPHCLLRTFASLPSLKSERERLDITENSPSVHPTQIGVTEAAVASKSIVIRVRTRLEDPRRLLFCFEEFIERFDQPCFEAIDEKSEFIKSRTKGVRQERENSPL